MKRFFLWLFPVLFCVFAATAQPNTAIPKPLRGMMIAPRTTAKDLRDLASLGANHVRWQLTWEGFPLSPADTASPEAYLQWLRQSIWYTKALLPLCDSLHLRVLIDLHTLPGGRVLEGSKYLGYRMFREKRFLETFRQAWVEIVLAFRNETAVWGYDLANEPEDYTPLVMTWAQLYPQIAAQVRALDSRKILVIEGAPSGSKEGLVRLRPLPQFAPVVYSFHMYTPGAFTHQGIYDFPTGISYPGTAEGSYWDSAKLRTVLQPVRDWQLKNNVAIYVGEFSAVRWAPDGSAYRYLSDCISLFEEWGWSWAYHAWREWDGWSVEHSANPEKKIPENAPTDRLLLLKNIFQKNKGL